jgi:hypothetical protein
MAYFDYRHFEYHRLIAYYQKLFGAERVLVLPYEQFRREPENYVARITRFAGARDAGPLPYGEQVNLAPSTFAITLQRRLNFIAARDSVNPWVLVNSRHVRRLVHRIVRNLSLAVPSSISQKLDACMKTQIAQLVGDRYAASNRLASELIQINLAELGYNISD